MHCASAKFTFHFPVGARGSAPAAVANARAEKRTADLNRIQISP
jgi:hypothetical protein